MYLNVSNYNLNIICDNISDHMSYNKWICAKICVASIVLIYWMYKEYTFIGKIEKNDKHFLTKRKKMIMDGNNIDDIDITKSEIINNVSKKHIFPFKEFKNFLIKNSPENIDLTFSQLFYSSSLTYVDDLTIKQLIQMSICDDHFDALSEKSRIKITTYIDECIEVIRSKIPLTRNAIQYVVYKPTNDNFSLRYSWSFSKCIEGYLKLANLTTSLNYGFYRSRFDDVDIYYKLTGKKNIILMFGGIVGSISSVEYMFKDLVDDYDIIFPVFPITNKPIDYNFVGNNDIVDYVEKIHTFLKYKKINTVHILAWSFGGFTSHAFTKNYTQYYVKSKFVTEGLITPFSCITSHMLINEPLTKSFTRLSFHMQNKHYSAMVAYVFLFKLKNIRWVSQMLLNFRNVQWESNLLDEPTTTLYFSKHDFLLPIDLHQTYINEFNKANIIINDGSHGYYLFSDKFIDSLKAHFAKHKIADIPKVNSCIF